jgi:hypothetical protein
MQRTSGGAGDVAASGESLGTTPGAGLDLSAAMVRAESGHLDATLHALVNRLSSVPGLRMRVSQRHGRLRRLIGDLPYINDLHRRSDPIQEIVVVVDPNSYWLHADHGSITCGRDFSSTELGEVKEELSFSAWATALFDQIAQQNLVNHDSILALRHLVEQDRVD